MAVVQAPELDGEGLQRRGDSQASGDWQYGWSGSGAEQQAGHHRHHASVQMPMQI